MPSYTPIGKPSTTYSTISGQPEREVGYLLTEDGDYLLQENGSRILLDFAGGIVRIFKPTTTYSNIAKPS